MKVVCVIAVLSMLTTRAVAQYPFDFMGMMGGMGNMMADIQAMSMNMAQQGQGMFADGMRTAQSTRQLGPGERTFTTHDGGRGFAYNSPDGSFSTFSFSSGGPSSGVMFYQGPDGRWERRW